jgi:hypothetical protein
MAKNPFSIFLFLKSICFTYSYWQKENILGQWEYVGQVLLKKRNPTKYSWPVEMCWTGTFKNKKT